MWWCQFIDLLKFETRPGFLLNFETANAAVGLLHFFREFKKTSTATGKSLNKRFNEQNNGFARAL